MRITESTTTQTYGGFKRSKLDTVASSTRRIFLCEGGVQEQSISGSFGGQCESSKKEKKRRITKSTTTPMYGGFKRSKLDTVASSTRRIFLCEGDVQARSKTRHIKPSARVKPKKGKKCCELTSPSACSSSPPFPFRTEGATRGASPARPYSAVRRFDALGGRDQGEGRCGGRCRGGGTR